MQKMTFKPVAMALVLGGLALSFTACKKAGEAVEAAKSAAGKASQTVTDAANDAAAAASGQGSEADSTKFNAYVECYNATNSRAHDAMKRYGQWVQDMEAGPTGNERNIYGVYTVNGVDKCAHAKGMADTSPAIAALDAPVKAYADALTEWAAKLEEADKYYSNEDYKDDQMAKGKSMHAGLVAAYKAFDSASEALSDALDSEGSKRSRARLAEVEKSEGKKFAYWHLSTMMSAEELANLLGEESFDTDKAQALIKAYEDASTGLKTYAQSGGQDVPMLYSSYGNEVDNFLTAAKKRMRRVRDNEAYSQGDIMIINNGSGWMVEGSPENMLRAYNQLVDSSNRMN